MLKTVILAENSLAPETWETVEVEDICKFLVGHFDEFPEHAKIYHGEVSQENDVTPSCEKDVQHLQSLEGTFHVIVYPADPVSIIVGVVFAVIAAVALGQDVPDPPEPMARKQDNSSPNNELSERRNRPRINGRIPDIFGQVQSTPDLIAPSYTIYENNVETDHSLLCIGRGEYDVPQGEIKEGTTRYSEIQNSTVEVYGPGVPPAPSSPKQVQIGPVLSEPFVATRRNNAVSGQTLVPFSDPDFVGASDIRYDAEWREFSDNFYYIENDGVRSFKNFIVTGSNVQIANGDIDIEVIDLSLPAVFEAAFGVMGSFEGQYGFWSLYLTAVPHNEEGVVVEVRNLTCDIDGQEYSLDGVYNAYHFSGSVWRIFGAEEVNPNWLFLSDPGITFCGADLRVVTEIKTVNLDGVYSVSDVTENRIYLGAPADVNADWDNVLYKQFADPVVYVQSPTLTNLSGTGVGPFTLEDPETSEVILNFSAPQGLYTDDGTTQSPLAVTIRTTIQRVDSLGAPVGEEEIHDVSLSGSPSSRGVQSVTGRFLLSEKSRCIVTVARTTLYQVGFDGQVSEEVKWVDLYGAKSISSLGFGDVTLVRSKGVAAFGTSGESRELNMEVTRKIPQRISGSDFTTELFPTSRADEIISFISLDPRIGNRTKAELDFVDIYAAVAEVESYFGTGIATEFNYTFDSDNISYEETMSSIARVIFCTAYRRGSQIKLSLEAETENSTLLFNHRNKLPGSETKTVGFGNRNDNDGVELDYVDPLDGSIQTFYLPDQNSINPQRVDTPGIRNKLQARFHAYRLWNKIQHQHVAVSFEATQEADLLVLGDRVLNADNTRPNIQDGEVESQKGLELTLSQKVSFASGVDYVIFLQYPDGTIESIAITSGAGARRVVLAEAPAVALSLEVNNYARATYLIVPATDESLNAFLVTEKQPTANFTSTVTMVNYDSRYYDNDKDFENGTVDADGEPI